MKLKEITPELQTWIESRPQVIQDILVKLHPFGTYRMAPTNQLCLMQGANENNTVRVVIFDELTNQLSYSVVGVDPDALTECDVSEEIKDIMLKAMAQPQP